MMNHRHDDATSALDCTFHFVIGLITRITARLGIGLFLVLRPRNQQMRCNCVLCEVYSRLRISELSSVLFDGLGSFAACII